LRHRRVIISIILTSLLLHFSAIAQVDLSSITLKVGSIRTLLSDEGYQYALCPELQIGGSFLTKYFNWGIYWSYWDDGLDKVLWKDAVIYSYSSHIVGLRMSFSPIKCIDNWYIPIDIFGGIAHHFIKRKYVGGIDWNGIVGTDYASGTTTGEVGLMAHVNITGLLSIVAEVQQYFPFGNNDFDRLQKDRRAYKIGLSYSI
jgi:hypothetical protein